MHTIEYCYQCENYYAKHLDVCPACKSSQSPEIVPKTEAVRGSATNTLLSFTAFKKQSPNKVSKEEYHRYVYLFGLQKDGYITGLETQVSFNLIPKVKVKKVNWYNRTGFTQSAVTYSPDFRYQYAGVTIIEEYKAVKKTKAGNYRPRINTTARNKVKLWIAKYAEQLIAGDLFFCISGWNRYTKQYTVFDSNGNTINHPLANYIGLEKAS